MFILRSALRSGLELQLYLPVWSSAGVRLFSGKTSAEKPAEPKYTYPSPGSSLREPGYGIGHSLSGAPHEYDPRPPQHTIGHSLNDPKFAAKPSLSQVAADKEDEAGSIAMKIQKKSLRKSSITEPVYPEPSYTYGSPGSSMKSPSYGMHSAKDPVYIVDPAPPKPAKIMSAKPDAKIFTHSKPAQTK